MKIRFETFGLEEKIVLEKEAKIYGRMDDFYIDGKFYLPILTNGYLHKDICYINLFGKEENI